MTGDFSIKDELERQSVAPMESTIPLGMTVGEWRRNRSVGNVVALRPEPCDHLHETTTRYDRARKQLSFLLVCPVCGTEKVVETQHYEPHPRLHAAEQPLRRAA